MGKRSKKNADSKRRLDRTIVVALIGLVGTIIAALLASPLLERWLAGSPSVTETTSPSAGATISATQGSIQSQGNHIGLNQTVTGKLVFSEAAVWIFNQGPANVTITLDVGPFGSALIILKDPSGVDRAYVDQQIRQGMTQLVNFSIPTSGDYTIWVRNQVNEPADYTLTVQDALTPPPP